MSSVSCTAHAPTPSPTTVTERPIFALLIGINEYQQSNTGPGPRKLRGCIEDSNAMHTFLLSTLHVPASHILLLQNAQATRAAILSAFQEHLIGNEAIKENDAVLFYFAGHGSRRKAPGHWFAEDGKVETICPYDAVWADDIPDYTLGHLIRKLAHARGNNITTIFDSCHSGGMGRIGELEEIEGSFSRCYNPPDDAPPLPDDIDLEILSSPIDSEEDSRAIDSTVSAGSMYKAMSSHVLLAACQPHETALESLFEEKWSGAFTQGLIAALRLWRTELSSGEEEKEGEEEEREEREEEGGQRKMKMTYLGLIESLPVMPHQHPHCEGDNRIRRLFSPTVEDGEDVTAFIVSSGEEEGMFFIAAGNIHGVGIGTEFITQPRSGGKGIHLRAVEVEELRCKVTAVPTVQDAASASRSLALPDHSRAIVSSWIAKWLRVELPPGPDGLSHNIREDDKCLFSVVSSDADLTVSRGRSDAYRNDNHLVLTRNDSLLTKEFAHCRHINVDSGRITMDYLNNASLFHFLLYQRNRSRPRAFTSSTGPRVSVSLQKLKEEGENEEGEAVWMSQGGNLFSTPKLGGNCVAEAVISDTGSRDDLYLLTLENRTSADLFAYVFYLDPATYDRVSLYHPHSELKPSLARHGGGDSSKLAIGYGAHGTNLLKFKLPKDKVIDTGFIKVFVSTGYINMEVFSRPLADSRLELDTTYQAAQRWNSWTYAITAKRLHSFGGGNMMDLLHEELGGRFWM